MTRTKKVLVITIGGEEAERVDRYSEIVKTQIKTAFSQMAAIQRGSGYRDGSLAPLDLRIEVLHGDLNPPPGMFAEASAPKPDRKSYGPWPLRLTCVFLLVTTLIAVFQNAQLVKQFQETTQDYIVGHQQMLRAVHDHGAAPLRCVAWGK